MAWTYNISSLSDDKTRVTAFGQVQFSGSYTTGGDATGTFVTTSGANTAGWPDFKPAGSVLHAQQAPVTGALSCDGGYVGVVVPVAGSVIPQLKLINPATGSELAAGAYPAAVTGAVFHSLQLSYRTNL